MLDHEKQGVPDNPNLDSNESATLKTETGEKFELPAGAWEIRVTEKKSIAGRLFGSLAKAKGMVAGCARGVWSLLPSVLVGGVVGGVFGPLAGSFIIAYWAKMSFSPKKSNGNENAAG